MTSIAPTVGRIVLYVPSARDPAGQNGIENQELAAIVCGFGGRNRINLAVFDSNGIPYSRPDVLLVQKGEVAPQGESYCKWMDYQIGQAAKHQAVDNFNTEDVSAKGILKEPTHVGKEPDSPKAGEPEANKDEPKPAAGKAKSKIDPSLTKKA